VVAADPGSGRPDFERVRRRLCCAPPFARQLARVEPVTFVAFDLLWADGTTLLDRPYAERRARLEELRLGGARWTVTPVFSSGAALWEATAGQGLEGVVAKRHDSRYRPGRRTRGWVKAKHWQYASLPIIGWTGRPDRVTSLLLAAATPDGGLRFAGTVEWGLPARVRAALLPALHALQAPRCALAQAPPVPPAVWVRPLLAARVRFQCWTSDGRLRHPLAEAVEPAAPIPSGRPDARDLEAAQVVVEGAVDVTLR
jgi:bifunctional non-homologous end joining protein LigD